MKPVVQCTDPGRLTNVLFFTLLLLFILLAGFVHFSPDNAFDRYIQSALHPLFSRVSLLFLTRLTFFGSFPFLFPAYILFIMVNVWQRKIRYALSVVGVALGGFLSEQLLKLIFQRHRPLAALIPNVNDYSFPSGHSTSSLIFSAVLSYSLWHGGLPRPARKAGVIFLGVWAFSIGMSRILLNVHFPTDVAAGFCFGALWIIAWYRLVRRIVRPAV